MNTACDQFFIKNILSVIGTIGNQKLAYKEILRIFLTADLSAEMASIKKDYHYRKYVL